MLEAGCFSVVILWLKTLAGLFPGARISILKPPRVIPVIQNLLAPALVKAKGKPAIEHRLARNRSLNKRCIKNYTGHDHKKCCGKDCDDPIFDRDAKNNSSKHEEGNACCCKETNDWNEISD